jgi:hypothetical protein
MEGFRIAASHFVERHGLVVIVALGESIVVLGVGAGGAEVGFELALIALLGLALSAALWWTWLRIQSPLRGAAALAVLATIPLGSEVSAAVQVAAIAAIIAIALVVERRSLGMLNR